jgi:hypothetical protein
MFISGFINPGGPGSGKVSQQHLQHPDTRRAFRTVRLWILIELVLSLLALAATIIFANDTSHGAATGVWIRCGVVTLLAIGMYVLVSLAARGHRWAYGRLRMLSIAALIGFIIIIVSPDYPLWLRIEQIIGGLIVIGVAITVNSSRLRKVFAKPDI